MIKTYIHLFFNYERFLNIWNRADSLADLINPILDTINNNMFGLCKLEIQKPEDIPTDVSLEIIDRDLIIIDTLIDKINNKDGKV
mgnify:CR=1 FL=1